MKGWGKKNLKKIKKWDGGDFLGVRGNTLKISIKRRVSNKGRKQSIMNTEKKKGGTIVGSMSTKHEIIPEEKTKEAEERKKTKISGNRPSWDDLLKGSWGLEVSHGGNIKKEQVSRS